MIRAPMHRSVPRRCRPARDCAHRHGEAAWSLQVDGSATGLRVRRADGFLARAVGLLSAPVAGSRAEEALLLPGCAAIHTLGMRRSIDVAFVDGHGRVLRAVRRLPPWRFAWCRGARATWEFQAGDCDRLGVQVGAQLTAAAPTGSAAQPAWPSAAGPGARATGFVAARCGPARARSRSHPMRGAAMVEFLLAGVLVLLPLTFATLELAQLVVARHALDYASFEAARSGAVHGADRDAMRRALARGLVPLFAPVDPAAALRGGAPTGGEQAAGEALLRAVAEVSRPDLARLEIENPTANAARDFALTDDGARVIPNDGLELRNPVGPVSGQSLREANVLAIRVRYCRRLFMPLVDRVVPALLRLRLADPFDQLCLAQRRVPIEARAVVHMQSPIRVAQLEGD